MKKIQTDKKQDILHGLRDGIPIAMGYFAVAFSLGIIAVKAGLTAPMGFLSSFFTRASAGEYGTYTMIAAHAAYVEVVAMCLVINLRYMLMSAALSQTFFWASGCALGIVAGSLLPQQMATALSVSLYGMFLAIIIPPSHKDKNVLYTLIASFTLSGLCAIAPYVSEMKTGMRTVMLTIVISAVAAWLKPIKTKTDGEI